MALLDGNFDAFKDLFPVISKASFGEKYKNFAVAEFRRFYSICATILANFHNTQTSIDEGSLPTFSCDQCWRISFG